MTNAVRRKPQKAAVIGSTLLIATIATTSPCPFQYWNDLAEAVACRIAPTATFATRAESLPIVPPATAHEIIANLRRGGMPVSTIAEAMRVERKTIYAWLRGGDVHNANLQRAAQVSALLTNVSGVDVRGVYRFWNTKISGNSTLRDIMTADTIDESSVKSVLDNLRPAALRAMESERRMSRQGPTNAVLDEIPEAGVNG
jgi:DNA-binding transcriptional ArsR family regulator